MDLHKPPQEVTLGLLHRSPCLEQIAAVLVDNGGRIFSLGWNHPIDQRESGAGKHAEEHALERANSKRVRGATIYLAGRRASSGAILNARPCDGTKNYRKSRTDSCLKILRARGVRRVVHTSYSPEGSRIMWKTFDL